MQSDARSVSKTSKATGLHGEIRLDRFFHRGHAVMLQQPGSEQLKRDEINILPLLPPSCEQSCNALHGSGFSFTHQRTKMHSSISGCSCANCYASR